MSYNAVVAKAHVFPHPKADRIQLASVAGNQVVVGLDVQDGDLGIFFPTDGILSHEYCEANDLYPVFDENGKRVGGGFFDRKRPRVRAQNFRGEKSDGYWAPIDSLNYLGLDLSFLVEGLEFSEINGNEICRKYYTPATLRAMQSQGPAKKKNIMFAEHVDTKQFRYAKDNLVPGALVTITAKVHGTSGRYAHVLDPIPQRKSLWDRLLRREPDVKYEWRRMIGTRRVILKSTKDIDGGHYGSHEFRNDIGHKFLDYLHKGEIVYGEIVGDVAPGQPIMPPHKIDKKDLPYLRKIYGDEMHYRYGCADGEHKFYVYRITTVNEDGIAHDLSWNAVKRRCKELGLEYVPEMTDPFLITEGESIDDIVKLVEDLTEGPSVIDPTHIREGVVVRLDLPNGDTKFIKNKSWAFGVMEGYIKTDDNYVDLEESS